MSKNFLNLKTGHHASDEYFKHMPIWNDSDILKTFLFGLGVGAFLFWVVTLVTSVYAADLTHTWKSPAFSGTGYSQHVLTIENQEFSRTKTIKEKKEAAERQAARDAANTNLSKFMKNVESRIYAQLSKQLVDSMFGESASETGTVTFEGTTISYVKSSDTVDLTIVSPDGSTTNITVPVGDFTF
jgi:curli production assembly/transport component CsgF|tara:strand:+ start:465 stop:1019 length:555 start_codon:yes stop_codon:yes gene_type:complete